MKRHPILSAATFVAALAAAVLVVHAPPALAEGCAKVEVTKLRPKQGLLMVAVYTSAESFGKTAAQSLRFPAGDDAKLSFELCGLAGGEVALTMFQDLDGDGKLGRNLLGIPTEPWGSSGKPGPFGPSWDTAKVALDGRVITATLSE